MAEGKYFWLKLKSDFFKRHDMKVIKSMPNGKDYLLFYLNLLLESLDHDGRLRFSNAIPYNEDMLAAVTDTNVDIVRQAIRIFVKLNLVEILDDGTYYMKEIERYVGSETAWAEKKRITRAKKEEVKGLVEDTTGTQDGHSEDNVRQSIEYRDKSIDIDIPNGISVKVADAPLPDSPPSESINPPLSKDKSGKKKKPVKTDKSIIPVPYQRIVDKYHDLCPSFPKLITLSQKRKDKMLTRWGEHPDIEYWVGAFVKMQESAFLRGENDNRWKATFDWLMENDNNAVKVLEGNYDNKDKPAAIKPPAPKEWN